MNIEEKDIILINTDIYANTNLPILWATEEQKSIYNIKSYFLL